MYEDLLEFILDSWMNRIQNVKLIERRKHVNIRGLLNEPRKIITVVGPRRSGKTYYLYQLFRMFSEETNNSIFYVNFEDERIPEEKIVLSDLISVINKRAKTENALLLLDEIQRMPEWSRWVRRIYDSTNYSLIVTGSTSKLAGYQLPSALAGRTISLLVLPLRFMDFLRFKGYTKFNYREILFDETARGEYKALFDEYLFYGGLPEVVLAPEYKKLQILQDYFRTVMVKDIARGEIRNYRLLSNFLRLLVNSKFFSISKIYNILKSLGYKVGKNTLSDYLTRAEEAFFSDSLYVYSPKAKVKLQLPRKVYVLDNGYISALTTNIDKGRLLENLVYVELKRRYWSNPLVDINYMLVDGKEVDFVIIREGKPVELIQVVYDLTDPTVLGRELDAIKSAWTKIGRIPSKIITGITFKERTIRGVEILPYWEWEAKITPNQTI